MTEKRTCEECGAELPANAPQGLCPRCLAKMGLGLLRTAVVPESDFQVERTGTLIGRYKLLEKIGEGGFGVVFMAEQVEPVQRKVALKIIKAGMDTKEVIARFEAERQAIALMDHPNIARALDAGATQAGRPYFVMELVRGIPITEYCDQNHLSTPERLQLFIKVCQAVQHAHQKGVIHRDLKPSNVLVTLHDGEPVPKVIDFGVAKALGQKLTEKTLFTAFHHMIGTPAYMSPEQAALSGLDIDTRADIYSLGVLLYELLTGVTPFDADTFRKAALDEIRRMIRETEPPKPSTRLQTLGERLADVAKHRGTIPASLSRLIRGDLDWIVMRCLEKDRKRRYETANGLAVDLARHLKSEPVMARPPSNLYRLQKLVRRHKLTVSALTAITIALVLAVVVSTWQALRANRAERQAKDALAQVQIQTAAQFFTANDYSTALAYLARVLRQNPTNGAVAAQVFSNLTDHLFVIHLAEPLTHKAAVYFAQFSPNGRRVVTASGDSTAQVWDATTGQRSTPPLRHAGPVFFAQFSRDGQRVVTASADNTARVWDANTGQALTQPLKHSGSVRWVYFSPDGERLVSADGSARIWDAHNGQLLGQPIENVTRLRCTPFSPDGNRIVLPDGTNAWIRDAKTGAKLIGPLAHKGSVLSAEFSFDGLKVLTASSDGTIRVWDATTGQPSTEPLNHGRPLWLAHFSSDGRRVVTVCQDNTTQVWDPGTGRALTGPLPYFVATQLGPARKTYARSSNWTQQKTAQFSPDGRVMVMAFGTTAQLLNANTGRALIEPLKQLAVTSAEFSHDSQQMVTASLDGTARIWGIRIGFNQLWAATPKETANKMPTTIAPVPAWVPQLLEALAEKRLDEQGIVQPVAPPQAEPALATNTADNTSTVIPLIMMQDVPLTIAIKNLAGLANLDYLLAPTVSYGTPRPAGNTVAEPTVSIRWENLTAEQALAALLNSFNLAIADDPLTNIARIAAAGPETPNTLESKIGQPNFANSTNMLATVQYLMDKRSKLPVDTHPNLGPFRRQLSESSASDAWTLWGKWLFAGATPQPMTSR